MRNRSTTGAETSSSLPSRTGGSRGGGGLEWALALILLGFILAISLTGRGYYLRIKAAAARAAGNELNTVADLKVDQLTQWRRERQADAELLLDLGRTHSESRDFLLHPTQVANRSRLLEWMASFRRHCACLRVVLLDTNLQVRLAAPETEAWIGPVASKLAAQALQTNRIIFSDLHISSVSGIVNMDCLVPLLDSSPGPVPTSRALGLFLMELDPNSFLFPRLQAWPTPSRTAETLLVRREGDEVLYLNELRHQTNTALKLRLPVRASPALPTALAVVGKAGLVEGQDYRGQPVLATLRPVPGTPWFLVAKEDLAEIYAPLEKQAWIIGEMVGAVILAASLGVMLVWRNREHHFSLRELAERKQAEEALRQSAERFAGFTAATFEGIGVNQNGRHLDVNDQYLALFGYRREEVIGREVLEFVAPESRDTVSQAIRSGFEGTYEHRALRKDGTVFDAECRARMATWEGRPVRVTALRDITQRKQAEAERERLMQELLRKNKELETVIYVSSHDLRSPLVNIQGFSHRLRGACEEIQRLAQNPAEASGLQTALKPILEEKISPSLNFILTSVLKMDALLSGLLRLSRLGRDALRIQELDMNRLASSATASLAYQTQQAGAHIEIADLPACQGDATQICQVLSNLLDNALKYRHPDRPPIISVGGKNLGRQARYWVQDNGLGVDASNQEKIWEIFQRADPSGLIKGEGLGLAIVRRILDRHNGRAWIESQPGEGSRFCFELPGIDSTATPTPTPSPATGS